MKLISSLSTGIFLLAANPVYAGLGPAEQIKGKFDAWCAQVKNECTVDFSYGKMTVDSLYSIDKSQMTRYEINNRFFCSPGGALSSSKCYGKGSILVFYNEDGNEGVGAFMFVDDRAFFDFEIAIKVFCGGDCRPVGPSVLVK